MTVYMYCLQFLHPTYQITGLAFRFILFAERFYKTALQFYHSTLRVLMFSTQVHLLARMHE